MNEYDSRWHHDRLIDERIRAAMPWVFSVLASVAISLMVLSDAVGVAIGLLAGAAILAAVLLRPEIALVAVAIAAPLEVYTQQVGPLVQGSGITPLNAVCLFLIIGAFGQRISHGEPATDATSIDRLLLLFVGWTGLSVLVGTFTYWFDPPAVGEWLQFACAFMMYWVARRRFRSQKMAYWAVAVIGALLVLESVQVIRQYHGMNTSTFDWRFKQVIMGTFVMGNSNDVATYLTTYGMVALGLFLSMRRSLWRFVALGVFALAAVASFQTYSRAAWFALVAGLMAVTLYKHKRYLVPAVIAVSVLPSVLPGSISARLSTSGDASAENRKEYWKNGLSLMLRNPQGLGWRGYAKHEASVGASIKDPHSQFVLIAAEQGVVGLGLFLALLAATGSEIVRSVRRAKTPFVQGLGSGMFGALVALCVNSLFGSRMMWFSATQHFWMLLGILVVLANGPPGTVVEEAPELVVEEKPESPWRYHSYV